MQKYDIDLEKRLKRSQMALQPLTPDDLKVYEQAGEMFDYAREAIKKEFQYESVRRYQEQKVRYKTQNRSW